MSAHTILIVEDNPITRKMLRFALESEGYTVIEGEDGRSALETSSTRPPDLVILDYVLPDMDGVRLLDELRRQAAREVPGLVVTGIMSRLEELRKRSGVSTQFLAKPVEPSHLLEVVRAQLSSSEGPPPSGRVLVIDDDLLNRKLASFRLTHAGYEVETAADAADALDQARRQPPDAILSDVLMPGMDGFAFCREAREDPTLANIPIVLVSSAYVDEADRELARKMGANALVVRTADLREATAALQESLARGGAPPAPAVGERVDILHRERLQVQLERQTARNEALLRQAAIQATALSIIKGLSEVLAQPRDVPHLLGDVLIHCLDAAGLSTGLLYVAEAGGDHRLQAQFGIASERKADAEACFGHADLIRRIAEARQPVALSSSSEDADVRDFLARVGHASGLVVPFVVLGETFGELVLASDSHDLSEPAWTGFARNLALQFGQTVALGQSLKRLAESEGRYRALMEQANDAILILDLPHRILEANREAERLLGRPRDEIVGWHYDDFVVPEERAESIERKERLQREGTLRVESRHFVRADGTRVPIDVSAALVRVEQWSDPVVFAILRDVTERKRAEETLRRSEARMKSVLDAALDAVIMMDTQGRVTSWNARAAELFGWPRDEAVGRVLAELVIPPRYRDAHVRGLKRFLATGEGPVIGRRIEIEALRRDGREFPVELSVTALQETGVIVFNAFVADISERKRAEEALRQAQQRLQHVVSSSPAVLYSLRPEVQAFEANWVSANVERLLGYTPEEALQAEWWTSQLHPDDQQRAIAELPALFSEGQLAQEYRFRTKAGDYLWLRAELRLLRDEAGNPVEVVGSWSDVTEKRNLESQLLQSQKMESIGRLAGGVAHDFNNLLGVMSGYGELLRKSVAGDARLRKYADDIVKAAERAAGLTGQLLAFSRKQVLQPKILDLNSVVAETEKMLCRLIGEDIELVTVFDERLGTVRADPGQTEQVLMNLAVNARDAMPKGGRLTIATANVDLDRAYARRHPGVTPGRYVMMAVSDTGHGMPPDVKTRIFEPFFTTKASGKGTGLGLATVHGIVKQSGGHVFVHSEPGRGATFKIYMPRADQPEETVEPPTLEGELPRGSETVLLVEDEGALRELIRECLESAGYTILDARNGAEALELCQRYSGPIQLLMTDVVMHGMSGRELAEQAAALRPEMRILYMSGYTDDAVVLHGVLGAEMSFLQKPFTEVALTRKLREVLDSPRR